MLDVVSLMDCLSRTIFVEMRNAERSNEWSQKSKASNRSRFDATGRGTYTKNRHGSLNDAFHLFCFNNISNGTPARF